MIHRPILPAATLFLPLVAMGQEGSFTDVHLDAQAPATAGFVNGIHISWGWAIVILSLGAVLIQNIVRMRKRPGGSQEERDQWHSDPANWAWGVFYHNKKDPRLFPPKRSYLGWTMNFANPYSIVAIVLLSIVLLIVIGIAKVRLK